MKVPVVLLLFNRPDLTQHVFDAVRRYQPTQLFVVGDGPRTSDEWSKCAAVRAVLEQVDWPCDVQTRYSDTNLGPRVGIAQGLTWVFEQCEMAIILEDDCVPHPSFFSFAEDLLHHYQCDERVMTISGDNFVGERQSSPHSYYFSRIPNISGWATWRRAWRHYDIDIGLWPRLRDTFWLEDILGDKGTARYWREIFDKVYAHEIKTCWDYQWTFACWAQNALSIAPRVNLVCNIGFNESATHAQSAAHPCANLPAKHMSFPLNHPPVVVRDKVADRLYHNTIALWPNVRPEQRLISRAYSVVPTAIRDRVHAARTRWGWGI